MSTIRTVYLFQALKYYTFKIKSYPETLTAMTKEAVIVNDNLTVSIGHNGFSMIRSWVGLPLFMKVVSLVHMIVTINFSYFSNLWKNYFIFNKFIAKLVKPLFTSVSIVKKFYNAICPCPSCTWCCLKRVHNFWVLLTF